MRKYVLILALCFHALYALPQGMSNKAYNFTSFSEDTKVTSILLDKKTSALAKAHPEYGIRPFNSQCTECIELTDQRTAYSRQFIDTKRTNYTYSQESYFALHYKDGKNQWRTIDPRLRPVSGRTGVYAAMNQPMPVKYNMADDYTSIDLGTFELIHDHNLSLYFAVDKNDAATNVQAGDYSHYTIGDDGTRIRNIWQGIDLEAIAKAGEVETDLIISAKPMLPASAQYMVIEDHISLPSGYDIVLSSSASKDLVVKSPSGHIVANIGEVRMYNHSNEMLTTDYVVTHQGNDYAIRMLVPVSFLDVGPAKYPIVIDPIVRGVDSLGNYASTGKPSANMNFSTMPAHCNYHMTVQVPGMSKLVRAYVEIESKTSQDPHCGDPNNTTGNGHICLIREIHQDVVLDTCNTVAPLYCAGNPTCNLPGTLSTDPQIASGAIPIGVSGYLACLPPQCPDYYLKFTLQNSDSSCQDVCSSRFIEGHMWRMMIEACQLDAYIDAVPTTVCAGQPVTLTCHPSCGVPPYHYEWTNGMTGQSITIYPGQDATIGCIAYDTCDNAVITNDITITVKPSPDADAGADKTVCQGGAVSIGGNPTTNSATSIVWTATPPSAQSRISNSGVLNPTITIPAGVIDTALYAVRIDDNNCFRIDSVYVFSVANPIASIDTTGATKICNGQSLTLHANGSFVSYVWNDGGSGQSHTVTTPGQYYVIVTDPNQCHDTSNVITITQLQVPAIHAYPDTTILAGISVTLYSDADLSPPAVDSFFWSPDVVINCLRCPNPVVTPPMDQTYVLTTYSNGCKVSDSATISVILSDKFYVPNAFSPNGDGNNDSFYIYYQNGVRVDGFTVFDRWGEKVHDGLFAWDGKYKGVICSPGVYVYMMSIHLQGKADNMLVKGSVTLIR